MLFRNIQDIYELGVCADIHVRFRGIIIRIPIADSCITGIIPIAARNQDLNNVAHTHICPAFIYLIITIFELYLIYFSAYIQYHRIVSHLQILMCWIL